MLKRKETIAVPGLLTDIEAEAIDGASAAAVLSTSLEERLEVTDPEVVLELSKHPAGEDRVQFALTALRIGVLSLRAAAGQLDATALERLVTN
jgi:hypothetical protein